MWTRKNILRIPELLCISECIFLDIIESSSRKSSLISYGRGISLYLKSVPLFRFQTFTLWTKDVNWSWIRRSTDGQDVFWMLNVCSILHSVSEGKVYPPIIQKQVNWMQISRLFCLWRKDWLWMTEWVETEVYLQGRQNRFQPRVTKKQKLAHFK